MVRCFIHDGRNHVVFLKVALLRDEFRFFFFASCWGGVSKSEGEYREQEIHLKRPCGSAGVMTAGDDACGGNTTVPY